MDNQHDHEPDDRLSAPTGQPNPPRTEAEQAASATRLGNLRALLEELPGFDEQVEDVLARKGHQPIRALFAPGSSGECPRYAGEVALRAARHQNRELLLADSEADLAALMGARLDRDELVIADCLIDLQSGQRRAATTTHTVSFAAQSAA